MKHFAILGYPLAHTLSPQIHKMLAEILGEKISYEILEIPPKEFNNRIPELMILDGFNITIPYKIKIFDFMNSLDDTAQAHGAMNVAALDSSGTHTGYNTDCTGFLRAMQAEGTEISGRVCVLGAGGVGRMFATECVRLGCDVSICVRENHLQEAADLSKKLNNKYSTGSAKECEIKNLTGNFDLLINATPAGMFPKIENTPINKKILKNIKTVFDCVYNPRQTRLMREAAEEGCKTFGGIKMLVWQAAAAQEIWFGRRFTQEQVASVIDRII